MDWGIWRQVKSNLLKFRTDLLVCLCLLLLIGCATPAEKSATVPETTLTVPPVSVTPSPSVTATKKLITPILTSTPVPTVTPTITSTPILTPTDTPTPPPEAKLNYKCLERMPGRPVQGEYTGSIVLGGYSSTPSYLFDLSTWEMKPMEVNLPDATTVYEAVSPDRNWLAYLKYPEDILVVRTTDEKQKIEIPWENNWFNIEDWLDNRHLLINLEGGDGLVLNPFTRERKRLHNDFPDISFSIGSDYWGMAKYNPDLTYAVYSHAGSKIVLWDLLKNKEITELLCEGNPYCREPIWNPKGNEFVTASARYNEDNVYISEELYKITKKGQISKLTNLISYYDIVEIPNYSWSPDGNQIAFWLIYNFGKWEDTKFHLAILDLNTSQVTEYCVASNYGNLLPPIWSPDGKQLVATVVIDDPSSGYLFGLNLLDLEQRISFKILGDYRLAGWMK